MPSTRRERRGGRKRPRPVKEDASEPSEEPEEVLTEDEITGLEAMAAEGRAELERGETRPLADLLEETLPAPDDKRIPINMAVLDTGQDPLQIEDPVITVVELPTEHVADAIQTIADADFEAEVVEFDTYVLRVPKGAIISLEKQE